MNPTRMSQAFDSRSLMDAAMAAAERAYAPYSRFRVGAAVLCESGDGNGTEVITGANVENGSFGLTICAERVALCKAVTEGKRRIVALAVWASETPNGAITPCGACRQVMLELLTPNAAVYMTDAQTGAINETRMDRLLPGAFEFSPPPSSSGHDAGSPPS